MLPGGREGLRHPKRVATLLKPFASLHSCVLRRFQGTQASRAAMTGLRLATSRAAAAALAALVLLAAAAPLAHAQISNAGPEGPRALQCGSTAECKLVQQMLGAAVSVSTNAKPPVVAAAAAAAPANVTSSQVAKALGVVLAAAVLESSVLDTLGNPARFK